MPRQRAGFLDQAFRFQGTIQVSGRCRALGRVTPACGSAGIAMDREPLWIDEVLRFWFEELTPKQWFARDPDLDALIRDRFLTLHEELVEGEAAGISASRGLLAAVITLDQFSRNIFRGTPRAYAADGIARRLSRITLESGCDTGMTKHERSFLYLPFQHSE